MKSYYIGTLLAIIAIAILQTLYTLNLHTMYVKEIIEQTGKTMEVVIAAELHTRSTQRTDKLRVVEYQPLNTMDEHTRDSLLRLHPLPSKPQTVNLQETNKQGVASTMGEAVQQLFQDELYKQGNGININYIRNLFDKQLHDQLHYRFVLYSKDKKTETTGNLGNRHIDYSYTYPIGTKGLQKLVLQIHIPVQPFIQRQLWIIGLSVALFFITLSILLYQYFGIKRKDSILIKKEKSINGSIHDLKAPLNTAISLLDLLKNTEKDDHKKILISRGESDIKSLLLKMERILLLSGNRKRHLILQKEPVNIETLIENVTQKMDLLFKAKKHSINTKFHLRLPFIIFSDAASIETIITNLLENALKYADENVCVDIIASQPTPAYMKIEIKDNGWGIPKACLKKLFTQFYQVPQKRHPSQNGYGIGLAQTKYLLKELGGNIKVSSFVDKGSTFAFTLPVNL